MVTGEEYHDRLRKQFKKMHPTPKWVQDARTQRDEEDEDEGLEAVIGLAGVRTSAKTLKPGKLKVERLKDANQESPSNVSSLTLALGRLKALQQGSVHSLEFHPSSNVLLCGSSDKRIRLFQIDGVENRLVQAVHIPELHLSTSQFHPSGSSVLMTGHAKPWLYSFDLQSGSISKSSNNLRKLSDNLGAAAHGERQAIRFSPDGSLLALSNKRGHISLLKPGPQGNAASSQFVMDLKTNGQVADLAFGADGNSLLSFGENSEVYVWDLRQTGNCMARWKDDGGFGGLTSSRDRQNKYLALG